MKILRGIGVFILSSILFMTIFGYTIMLSVKEVVQHQVAGEVVKTIIKDNASDLTEEEQKRVSEVIDSFVNDKELDKLITSVIDEIDSTTKGNEVKEETVELIIKYCVNHLDDINKIANTNYTVSDVDNAESRTNIRNAFKEVKDKLDTKDAKVVVDIVSNYSTITSKDYTFHILGIVFALVVLIALIQFSFYKWLKTLGTVVITSGCFTTFIYFAFRLLFDYITSNIDFFLQVDVKNFLTLGIGEICVGLILIVIFYVIRNVADSIIQYKELKKS